MADLRIGFVMNPLAGVGGPVALKGSDGVSEEAFRRGAVSKVADRVTTCLKAIKAENIAWIALPGVMGGDLLESLGMSPELVGEPVSAPTTAAETRQAVETLAAHQVDLLLFAGGDGTARDVLDVFAHIPAALGIPCGVKMHSGVFATSPSGAAALIDKLAAGEVLSVMDVEIRDIDEASFRDGVVKTAFYGELPVPEDLRYVQQTKIGGKEVEDLVLTDIAADFTENMQDDVLYIMGSGSTIGSLQASMDLPATLLGIDVVRNRELVAADVGERELLDLIENTPARIVVTAISGQGHLFGRGNQQLSADVIRRVGVDNIDIVATKSKLAELEQRPLLVDTGDAELDEALSGLKTILTGYEDRVLYRVASA